MPIIAWDARYRTGIATIDRQHQSLFNALKSLHEGSRDADDVERLLTFLQKYAQIHFADEEMYMERIGFPDLAAHRMAHFGFTQRIQDLIDRQTAEPGSVLMESSLLLFGWLRDHIMVQDMAYVAHAKAKGYFVD